MGRLNSLAVILGLSACSSGPDEGAILTFESPEGPISATRIEVILANAAPTAIADVDNQRRAPGSDADDAVRYYRQRALGGVVEGMKGVAGFQLRIEPDITTSTDEEFIPLVFVYDGDALVGVGAVEDALGDPAAVQITPGMITRYPVVVTGVSLLTDPAAPIERGTARTVSCSSSRDQEPWRSGVAWFPVVDPARPEGRAHQLRLLLPDVSVDPAATDASAREADLDCDQHPAANNDCDDLRSAYYNGAAESCDGFDTNCDSQRFIPQGCTPTNAACNVSNPATAGVQICDDTAGTLTACTPSAACLCSSAGGSAYCTKCTVDFTGSAATKAACSPSVGKVTLTACEATSCDVEVVGATTGWRAFIGTAETGPFTNRVVGVHNVYLEAKFGPMLAPTTGSIGEIYLRLTSASGTTLMPIQMEMGADGQCAPIPNGMGTSRMTCSP